MNAPRAAAALRELAAAIEDSAARLEPVNDDPGLTLSAAGILLGSKDDPVHASTVARMVRKGLLKAYPIGKSGVRVLQSSVLELKKKGTFPRRVA